MKSLNNLRKIIKNVIFDISRLEIVNYNRLKCIELQNQNGLTPAEEISLFEKMPTNSNECVLIYLNILLKRQKLPILCQKTLQILETKLKTASPSPIRRRIELLTGESTITSLFEEDDLLVLHLLHSDQILVDFDEFAKCTNYRDKKSEVTLKWNDPDLKIRWPITKPILSKKDKEGLLFSNF